MWNYTKGLWVFSEYSRVLMTRFYRALKLLVDMVYGWIFWLQGSFYEAKGLRVQVLESDGLEFPEPFYLITS